MRVVTEDADIRCAHVGGKIANKPSQSWVTIAGRKILVDNDPVGRSISGCPNAAVPNKPCLLTVNVRAGYSTLVRIDGHAICLDTLVGLTDGTPPGVVEYKVRNPGQTLVSE